ncbi:restriction endonuclease subunit S, partial [Candidatus Saccharibacteria bacterium]|nr:restriction endonuclease subunit S [Candidatus Saccharibacteria bacterium]
ELEAELEARRKQYEYYKQSCFDSIETSRIEHITDIATVKARVGWQRLTKSEHLSTGDYQLITGTDFTLSGDINFSSCVFVTKDRYDMDTNIQVHKDDILITKDGTLGKVALVRKEPTKPTTLNSGVFRITLNTDEVLPSYIYHFFTSKYFLNFVESVKTGSTIPHLTQQGLTTLNIPIPTLNEQKRIVTILDNFNKLINGISEGLPAEITARRQQYEYYRSKLLTFEEAVA